jgi:hypothetical protein
VQPSYRPKAKREVDLPSRKRVDEMCFGLLVGGNEAGDGLRLCPDKKKSRTADKQPYL